jgi:two-component system, cell cycle sensor histidine kinase and response regulator CckA
VIPAHGGETALRIVERGDLAFDILVTDVVMPGMSGPQLAERMGRLLPGIKILYISRYTDDALGPHGILDEGIEFLAKPFTPHALAARLRQILDGTLR